jgi:hypothetical protein
MMRKLTICLVAAVMSLAAVLSAMPALAADDGPRNVILIGWDGAQRAHVQECLARGELPALKKLSEQGALVDIDVVNGATDTKAGWSQILTGYNPEVTGVYSNGKYRDVPKGLSVFERLEGHFMADMFVTVAVIGKSAHCGEIRPPSKTRLDANTPVEADKPAAGKKAARQPGAGKQAVGRIVEENGVKYRVFGGSPYYTMHKSCDVWEYGLVQDEKVGSRALELLDKYKDNQFFFFVHFAEVDHSGHKAGENSKEYNDALISGDTWTGKIIDKLKQLGLYDKTTVYVTADHGFNEDGKGHSYAPYVFLGTNDARIKRAGMRQDITPTVLERFGLDLGKFEPKLDGESLAAPAVKPVLKAPESRPAAPIGGLRPAGRKKKAA